MFYTSVIVLKMEICRLAQREDSLKTDVSGVGRLKLDIQVFGQFGSNRLNLNSYVALSVQQKPVGPVFRQTPLSDYNSKAGEIPATTSLLRK